MKTLINRVIIFSLFSFIFLPNILSADILKMIGYDSQLRGVRFTGSFGAVVGDAGRVWVTTNTGNTWTQAVSVTQRDLFAIDFVNASTGFAVGMNGCVIRTIDGGSSWTVLPIFTNTLLINVRHNGNEVFVTGAAGEVWKSTDAGNSWTDISVLAGFLSVINDIGFADNKLFAVAENTSRPIWISTNNGVNWSSSALPGNVKGTGMYIGTDKHVVIGYASSNLDPKVCKSSNRGQTWFTYDIPTGIFLKSIDFVTGTNTGYLVGSTDEPAKLSRVYKTTNAGNTWVLLEEYVGRELFSLSCTSTYMYVSGDSGTIFRSDISVGIQPISSKIPDNYTLSQNYPNPFNPETNINFSLPQKGNVKLSVYNMIGKEVSVLYNGKLDAGVHNYNFNAANLPSGTYFYKLETNGFIATKKMMLIK